MPAFKLIKITFKFSLLTNLTSSVKVIAIDFIVINYKDNYTISENKPLTFIRFFHFKLQMVPYSWKYK